MIAALREVWASFWHAFRSGYRQAALRGLERGGDEPPRLRDEAEAALESAMKRYGLTQRDRTHHAGRES